MTPKEKAEDLFKKYYPLCVSRLARERLKQAKQCALIAVEEIIRPIWVETGDKETEVIPSYSQRIYWQEVKQEIEKL